MFIPLALPSPSPVQAQAPTTNAWAQIFLDNMGKLSPFSSIQTFSPATRAHLAVALATLIDSQRVSITDRDLPADVSNNHWAAQPIAKIHKLKILSSNAQGQFQPDRVVSKGEALLAIAKTLGIDQQTMATPRSLLASMYTDAHTIPAYAIVPIASLTARGLVVNYPQVRQLGFNQPITSAELVALIHQGLAHQRRIPFIHSPHIVDPRRPLPNSNQAIVTLLEVSLSKKQVTAFQGDTKIKTYKIAVGRAGWETPLGTHRVQQLIERPAWKNPFTGDVIASGDPENPLGERWIGFWTNGKDWSGFHGTPNRASVGQAISHGCIRMYNEDIIELFKMVSTQTIVRVVR